jgi:hypothetical protein
LLSKLSQLMREILALFRYLLRFLVGQNSQPDAFCEPCVPALKKPDPFIYSQYYLMSLGYPVTWDNPDIYIFDGGVLVDPHELKASTSYTVVARIWNNSTDAPVVDLKVSFSYLSFGIGAKSNPIGATTTDLGAKGLPGCPAFAYITWTTPSTLGHYCIQVLLEPPDDSNWLNNLGQRNTEVAEPKSPAVFTFAVGNHDSARLRTVRFTVDTYSIPPLPSCDSRASLLERRDSISKSAPVVPEGWIVAITPSELQLAPGEEQPVSAEITPPPGFSGSMPFNITAHDPSQPIGGVTLTVAAP